MQDNPTQASHIAREARSFSQGLKESVKTREPWDREVEFQRRNLRAQYLKLLLLQPYAKESKDAETHLWMQTSYQFIASYKQRISVLDRKLYSSPQKHQPRQDHGGGGHVEYRKILQRFRQFLAEEEKFWMQLLVRFRRSFALDEAQPALAALDILRDDQDNVAKGDSGRNTFPEESAPAPTPPSQLEGRMSIFTKLLVCLGDIERYREQYNESGGRPRAGHEEGSPRKGGRGGKRGGAPDPIPRPRNYIRAQTSYEHARLLVPDDGNASHQLAILASYQKDSFGSLLHYYRALCVRQPYDTASDNLNTVLKKALEQFKGKRGRKDEEHRKVPRFQVEQFKEWVVVLHAFWKFDSDESAAKASKHALSVVNEFSTLLAERVLPSDIISKVIVLALGALWKLRMIREPGITKDAKRDLVIEPLMAGHILDLFRTLLQTGYAQLQLALGEAPDDRDDLAQRITAEFRRTLPALRITSKWLRSNLSYIESAHASAATSPSLAEAITKFWNSYALFFTALSETFPRERLPALKAPLEEDVDMSGFSPIKRLMFKTPGATENGLQAGQSQVHPNEEQLMRIADLLDDALSISDLEKSPITFNKGMFVRRDGDAAPEEVPALASPPRDSLATIMDSHPDPPRVNRDNDEDNMTQTSRTDDDPVRDAFRAALGSGGSVEEDEEQDDEIVWDPRASLSPLARTIQPPHPSPPAFTSMRPSISLSPTRPPPPAVPHGTTAGDLLNDVLGLPRTPSDLARHNESSAPQASLLFGSGSPSAPTTSIWTNTDRGTKPFGSPNLGKHMSLQQQQQQQYMPTNTPHGRSLSLSQPWGPSYPLSQNSAQDPQQGLIGSGLSTSFVPGPTTGNVPHIPMHKPAPSLSALPPSAFHAPPFMFPGTQPQNNVPPVHLQGQTPGMVPFADGEYHMPYHHDRDPRIHPAFNAYVPPIQRAWGNS